MSAELTLVEVLQRIVRDELRRVRFPEPAVVVGPAPEVTGGGDNHYHCNVRLRYSGLELASVPIAAGRKGEVALPSEGDLVLVSFMGGDLNAPVITGRLYGDEDAVPEAKPGEYIYEQPEPEQDGLRRVYFKFPGGATVTATDKQIELVAGETKVTVDKDGAVAVEAKGDLTLKAGGDIRLESGKGGVTVKAAKALALEGGTNAQLKAKQIAVKGLTDFSQS
ncbi:MAG TPA: phage baseplate assembly protein V [Symbiobacteriaceae bacterium]|nr:phage baseplate assembly protein V [Symbiobacteriaceae bacterium]